MAKHICPWYIGYLLINPLRRLLQDPGRILGSYVKPGMRVLEVGPGMGFFSLPLARLVGESGKVYTVDVQESMLKNLRRRAVKAHLQDRIETRRCDESSLRIQDLSGSIDFALAFAVIHEVADQKYFLREMIESLKKQGLLFISEPKGHVTEEAFEETLSIAQSVGMEKGDTPAVRSSHSALLKKI